VFVVVEYGGHFFGIEWLAFKWLNDYADGQIVFAAELEVALVVGGNGHDGAGSVLHEDEIADPDGKLFAVERIHGVAAGEDTYFFGGGEIFGFDGSVAHDGELGFGFGASGRTF
jgi:hypothetical protein